MGNIFADAAIPAAEKNASINRNPFKTNACVFSFTRDAPLKPTVKNMPWRVRKNIIPANPYLEANTAKRRSNGCGGMQLAEAPNNPPI